MANNVTKLIDSTRRLVVRMVSDGGSETNVLKIDGGSLAYALNANGYILGAGTDRAASYGLELQKIFYSVNGTGYFNLYTDGDSSAANVVLLLSGSGAMAFEEGGNATKINCASLVANTKGNIFVTATAAYTVVADFRKMAYSYDQGQTADPTAFNRGPASGFGQ